MLTDCSVVIDVVDLERHEIFDLIGDLPDKESRVIGVINKCDTKQKQSADWVGTPFNLEVNRANDIGFRSYPKCRPKAV